MSQHKYDAGTDKANMSGISKHAKECVTGNVDWENPTIIASFHDKDKKKLQSDLLLRESIEIRRQDTGPGKGLNDQS